MNLQYQLSLLIDKFIMLNILNINSYIYNSHPIKYLILL